MTFDNDESFLSKYRVLRIDTVNPSVIIPMHTEMPEALAKYYPDKVKTLQDGEVYRV